MSKKSITPYSLTVEDNRFQNSQPKNINFLSFIALLKSENFQYFHQNKFILIVATSYIVYGYAIQSIYNIEDMMKIKYSYSLFHDLGLYFTAFFMIVQFFRGSLLKYISLNRFLSFITIILLAVPIRYTYSSIKQVIPKINNFKWDESLMEFDKILHMNHHPWNLLSSLLNYPIIINMIDNLYMIWFLILFLMIFWMAWSSRERLRIQFFITLLLAWFFLGSILGIIFSSAGPCYFSLISVNQTNPYFPLMEKLYSIHDSDFLWAIKNQMGLLKAHNDGLWLPFGGISAMPSLHVGVATLFALIGWRLNLLFGILFTFYLVIIQIGSVILGWHYAIDGYLSFFLITIIWKSVGIVMDKLYKPKTIQLDEKSYQRV